ncbi:MAG: methyltransferase domain-containing protein [Nitrospirota bacterium]
MGNLQRYLDSVHYPYSTKADKAQAIFFPISHDMEAIKRIKERGGKVIQRLDGVYYPLKHPDKYREMNKALKQIYQDYADFVVFQSSYSRQQCFAMFGEKAEDKHTMVLNGVDKTIFYPEKEKHKGIGKRVKFVTTGNFRNIDMIEPVVKALDKMRGRFKFELNIVGPIVNPTIEWFFHREYINLLGNKNLYEIAEILRNNNIFLYSHLNPPCPNSVIEAISCGLPVVGFDSGAMTELCFFSKELLAHVSDGIFHAYEDFDYKKLAEKIHFVVEQYERYQNEALAHAHLYSFDKCGKQYIEVFEKVMTKSTVRRTSAVSAVKVSLKEHISSSVVNPYTVALFEKWLLQKQPEELADYLHGLIKKKSDMLSPFDSLKFLFDIENRNYQLEGHASVRYGNGVHTKHWHIKYHDFFIENIPPRSRVLDVGCGIGALAYDIAMKVPDVFVYGVDVAENNIKVCKERFQLKNINYVHGDALNDLPDEKFDVIVLSNVLEHIEKRVEFLRVLSEKYKPRKILIRVPMFERDWRVPLKKELGVDYRLDSTHHIEYCQEEFFDELKSAGLTVIHYTIKWGEIWAEIVNLPA